MVWRHDKEHNIEFLNGRRTITSGIARFVGLREKKYANEKPGTDAGLIHWI
jgi:hypothetical protein